MLGGSKSTRVAPVETSSASNQVLDPIHRFTEDHHGCWRMAGREVSYNRGRGNNSPPERACRLFFLGNQKRIGFSTLALRCIGLSVTPLVSRFTTPKEPIFFQAWASLIGWAGNGLPKGGFLAPRLL